MTKRVNFRSNRKLIECLEFLENNEAKYDYEFIIKNIIRLTEGSKKNYKDTLTSSDPTYESQNSFKDCLETEFENYYREKDNEKVNISTDLVNYSVKDRLFEINTEIRLYTKTGVLGPILKQFKLWLKTIKATSCEPERMFSTAGNILGYRRTRIKDELLNDIIFLKYYYK